MNYRRATPVTGIHPCFKGHAIADAWDLRTSRHVGPHAGVHLESISLAEEAALLPLSPGLPPVILQLGQGHVASSTLFCFSLVGSRVYSGLGNKWTETLPPVRLAPEMTFFHF